MSTIYSSKYFLRHADVSRAGVETGARGPQGEPGPGIVSAKLDGGRLIFTLSNGTTLDAGNLLELIKSAIPTSPEPPTVRAVGAVRPPK